MQDGLACRQCCQRQRSSTNHRCRAQQSKQRENPQWNECFCKDTGQELQLENDKWVLKTYASFQELILQVS